MNDVQRPFVDYYKMHGISPVDQNIDDLQMHFRRRRALYQQLGVVPSFLQGKKIIEFGPGSGHNALFTLSCKPAKYVLVDANPYGLSKTKKLLEDFKRANALNTALEFHESLIEEYTPAEHFDLVCCEGLLSMQLHPDELLRKVVSCADEGGVTIISCSDPVSALSDIIRRVIGNAINDDSLSLQKQAAMLARYFTTHFSHLPNMSRSIDDWVLDNVLQPFYGKFFSIADAVSSVDSTCDVLGCSPAFVADWRWYKDISQPRNEINELTISAYYCNIHNLIDNTCVSPPFDPKYNQEIYELANLFFFQSNEYHATKSPLILCEAAETIRRIAALVDQIGECAQGTSAKLRDAAHGLQVLAKGSKFADVGSFSTLFGRGQQYLSFVTIKALSK